MEEATEEATDGVFIEDDSVKEPETAAAAAAVLAADESAAASSALSSTVTGDCEGESR